MAIHFQEGQQVKAGDLLAEIDPSQFKVALAQAQGQLAKDKATLANARRDLARYQQLVKTNLVSRQELDTQQSLVSETRARSKPTKPPSPAPSCSSTGAASPRRSTDASA
jgi:multidrug efflux system membrane fusion protein